MFGIISAFLTTEGLSDSMSRPRKLGITKVGLEAEGNNKVNRSQRRCRVAKLMRVNKGKNRMKKIMIAAAVAAIGFSVFGAACSPDPQVWVYKWQFKGKTTTGKKATIKTPGSVCKPGGTQTASCTIRVPASLKIQGYTWACPGMECATDNTNLGFETAWAECNELFWQTKPYKASFYGGVTTEFAHLIGKKRKQAEVLGVANFTDNEEGATYVLTYAGFGKVKNSRGKYISKVSGNFAGSLSQPWVVKKAKKSSACCTTASSCVKAGYWDCATLSLICEAPSIAYGKWSAKYLKSASAKYTKNGSGIKTPNWVVQLNTCN